MPSGTSQLLSCANSSGILLNIALRDNCWTTSGSPARNDFCLQRVAEYVIHKTALIAMPDYARSFECIWYDEDADFLMRIWTYYVESQWKSADVFRNSLLGNWRYCDAKTCMSVAGLLAPVTKTGVTTCMPRNAWRTYVKDYLSTHSLQRATPYLDLD